MLILVVLLKLNIYNINSYIVSKIFEMWVYFKQCLSLVGWFVACHLGHNLSKLLLRITFWGIQLWLEVPVLPFSLDSVQLSLVALSEYRVVENMLVLLDIDFSESVLVQLYVRDASNTYRTKVEYDVVVKYFGRTTCLNRSIEYMTKYWPPFSDQSIIFV